MVWITQRLLQRVVHSHSFVFPEDSTVSYPFGIISLSNKKSCPPVNTAVEFQVARVSGSKERAVNVVSVRELVTGCIDSIKGSFGFIDIPDREKNVYFRYDAVHRTSSRLEEALQAFGD